MKELSTRAAVFPAVAILGAILLTSCEGMGDMYDSHSQQAVYTDAYAPNALVIQDSGAMTKTTKSSNKVSAKEITQTTAPAVSTTHRVSNSQQVPLSAPTVE